MKQGTYTMKFYAKHVSVAEFNDQYLQVSFDSEPPSEDAFDLSGPDRPYLIVQRQFEDDDGGVCCIETHDHDAYSGHFRLQLIEFTPTRLFFEIARAKDKYVEVAYDLGAKKFGEESASYKLYLGCKAEAPTSGRNGMSEIGGSPDAAERPQNPGVVTEVAPFRTSTVPGGFHMGLTMYSRETTFLRG